MLITLISVSAPETVPTGKGQSYQRIQVAYKNAQGKVEGKNLVSYAFPEVFKFFAEVAKEGSAYEIAMTKNAKGYWDWTSVAEGGATPAPAPQASNAAGPRKFDRDFESSEERALKQKYIVRQSSITSAMQYFTSPKGINASVDDVLALAARFEEAVFKGFPKAVAAELKQPE